MGLKVEDFKSDFFWLKLSSGDEEYPGCRVKLHCFDKSITLDLPQWILKPHIERVEFSMSEKKGEFYDDIISREYGFVYDYIHKCLGINYGQQSYNSNKSKSKSWFIPWLDTRFTRYLLIDEEDNMLVDLTDYSCDQVTTPERNFDAAQKAIANTPKSYFLFRDYDGEKIIATTCREEREWKQGTGWFKWVSYFTKNIVRKSLEINFSSEVGNRKGSWKGGTLGHSIELNDNESSNAAFTRYCRQEKLTYMQELNKEEAQQFITEKQALLNKE